MSKQKVDWATGLFRLWVVLALGWVLFIAILAATGKPEGHAIEIIAAALVPPVGVLLGFFVLLRATLWVTRGFTRVPKIETPQAKGLRGSGINVR
jgi:hypothetical protein